ncbi:MAG: protein kinase [Gemmataceae bacterium]
MVETLGRAVHFAHERGVVHRDLKPANVLLTGPTVSEGAPHDALPDGRAFDGVPKIADFGLAKQLDAQLTQTGTNLIVGTPTYMAPEQAAGGSKAVGPAADVYALGVTLYECLTGRPPFQGADVVETLQQVRFEDPVPPSRLRPGLPRDLETVCLKCLEKDPVRRYSSAAALADDLERFRDGRPILARPTNSVEHVWKWAKRRPGVAVLSAATVVSVVLGAVLYSVAMAKYAEEREKSGRAEGLYLAKEAEREAAVERATREGERAGREGERAEREEWSSYNLGLELARQLRASDAPDGALLVPKLLQRLPANRRGWEVALFRQPRHTPWGTLSGGLGEANSVAYSPDGKLLAIGAGVMLTGGGKPRPVQVWDLTTRKRLPDLDGLTDPVSCVVFSPCGKFLAGATYWFDQEKLLKGDLKAVTSPRGRVLVWELASRRVVQEFNGVYNDARFSRDGRRFFATGLRRLAHVWDVTTSPWKELPPLPVNVGPSEVSTSVAPGPDGKRLVTLQQGFLASMPGDLRIPSTAQVWDVDARKPLFRIDGAPTVVRAVAYSPDGRRIVTGSFDGVVKIWDADTGRLLQTCPGHSGEVQAVAFNRDGTRFATGGLDEVVKVWVTATGREVASIQGHSSKILTIAFDPSGPPGDERLTSGDKAGVVKIWDSLGKRQPREFLGHTRSPVTDLAFSGDGRTLASTCQLEKTAIVWDVATGKPRQRFDAPAERIALSPDGKVLATAGGLQLEEPGHLKLWDVVGRLLHEIKGHPVYVYSVAFSPDGRSLLSASGNPRDDKPGFVKVHDVATGAERASFRPDLGVVSAVTWHPKFDQIALAGQEKVALVCRRDGTRPRRFTGIKDFPLSLAFSPDGNTLACGDFSGAIYLWDADTGGEPKRLTGHRTGVSKLSFHPDGKRLVSAGHNMYFDGHDLRLHPGMADVRLWDLPSGREVLVMPGSMAAVISPDGNDLALGAREVDVFAGAKIELWNAKPPTKP